jgi:hypothetical protein
LNWAQAASSHQRGAVSIVSIERKGTISDKELGERIASTRKEWNNCSKL